MAFVDIFVTVGTLFQPLQVLGVYTYTRKVTLDEFESKPRRTMVSKPPFLRTLCSPYVQRIAENTLFGKLFWHANGTNLASLSQREVVGALNGYFISV